MLNKRKNFLIFSLILILLTTLLITGSFGVGFLIGNSWGKWQSSTCPPEEIDFSLFWESYHKIYDKFFDPTRIDRKKIIYGAISGMLKSLDDPYTVFLSPEESKKFQEDVKGEFEGVGMEIGIKKGELQVIAPLEGTPAQRAGLRPGDKILKINDKETFDLTIEQAVDLIRGPKGTEVTLTIFRSEWEKPKEFKIKREVILVPSLKWEIKENDVAYIKIYQFSEKADFEFNLAASKILASSAKKIILDLRNNPGGYLEIAQKIAGWFLEKGQIVVIEDFCQEKKRKEFKSEGPSRFSQYPMVVLINQGSASASEILAGALRDNRGILLIGEKTFGKGSVQELLNLKEGSLKITVANWLTPKGILISEVGLEPDIKIEITEKEHEEGKDPQLEKALEIIKKL